MDNLELDNLEKALNQIEKYNKDFSHYFLCLKTANFQIKSLRKEINKTAKINLNKQRDEFKLAKILRVLTDSATLNKSSYLLLEPELKNLKTIVDYLKEQQPKFDKICNYIMQAKDYGLQVMSKGDLVKLVTSIRKLNSNLNLCDKYIFPKNKALIKERKGIQSLLEYKKDKASQQLGMTQEQENR